jgi:hypothetical protein
MADSYGESALLHAVECRIAEFAPGIEKDNVDVTIDERFIPLITGHWHVIVMPNGRTPGSRHNPGGHIRDELFSVRVVVVMRIQNLPQDRKKKRFIEYTESLDEFMGAVKDEIDWNYKVTDLANADIAEKTGSTEGFIHPLVWQGDDSVVTPMYEEEFGHGARSGTLRDQAAGLKRGMQFGMANRIQAITSNYS